MFRRTASITIASIASVGLLTAVALGASLTLDNAPKAQLEDIQVFPDSDEPRIATPHVEPEQPAPPLTLPQSIDSAAAPESAAKRPTPKSPVVILPPTTEPVQPEPAQPEAAPTTPAPPTTGAKPEESTTVPKAPESLPPAPVKPEPVEIVLPPVVENPEIPDEPEAPVEPRPSKPGKGNKPDKPGKGNKPDKPGKGNKKDNNRDPWEEIVDDWKDKIDKGDWDVEIDWDNGEWKISRDDDDDDDDD